MTRPAVPFPIPSLARRVFASGVVLTALWAPVPAVAETTAPAAAAPLIGKDVSTFDLPNGLTVVVVPDHRAPVVTHMVWYRAGSADEPAGKSGIAHYLEHLMFKGTPANPAGAFSRKVAEIGGQENAFTSYDFTAYYQRVAKEHLGLVMALEADRMQNLALDQETATPELKVVLEERSMRTDNDPSARLAEAMEAMSHPGSPYRIPVIGWRHEIEKLTAADATAFYDRFYTPNNAILVVAGDVETSAVRDLALATYGRVPRRAEPGERHRPKDPDIAAIRTVALADERVNQPSWRRSFPVPSSRSAAPGESEALELLTDVLGGGSTSRLYRKLVVEQGVASQAGAFYQSDMMNDTRLMIYAVPRDGVSFADLAKAVDAVVADLVDHGPTNEEVARSANKVVAREIHAQDNQASLAQIFGEGLAIGGTVDGVRTWPARIRAVPVDAVAAAARRWLVADHAVTGELRPAPASGKALGKAAWPPLGPGAMGPIRMIDEPSDRGLPAPFLP